jgi:chemotaxis protein MotB
MKSSLDNLRVLLEDTGEDQSNMWMLPFSTLMLILMILFAALYGNSYMQSLEYETALAEMEASEPDAKLSRSMKEILLAKDIKKFLSNLELEGAGDVSITAHEIKIKLSSPVLFESGNAELKPDIMPLLVRLLGHLLDMDNTIIVEGHTDNIPINSPLYRSNWELSASRAFSVIYFYIKRDIEPKRLLSHGFGEFRPFFSNDSEFGRAMNRRIEITILRGEPRQ